MLDWLYKKMVVLFLNKPNPNKWIPGGGERDDKIDYYYLHLGSGDDHISIERIDDNYLYGYATQLDDHHEEISRTQIAIELSKLNWDLVRCDHYYKRWVRQRLSFKSQVFRKLTGIHKLAWWWQLKSDKNHQLVSDRYQLLEIVDGFCERGERPSTYQIMDIIYGESIRNSTRQRELRMRIEKVFESLEQESLIDYDSYIYTYSIDIKPKGIAELHRYREERQRHEDSMTTANVMKRATLMMTIAVIFQAVVAVLTFYKSI